MTAMVKIYDWRARKSHIITKRFPSVIEYAFWLQKLYQAHGWEWRTQDGFTFHAKATDQRYVDIYPTSKGVA